MATGDIGAIIETLQWAAGARYRPFISHVTENIYLIGDAANGASFTVYSVSISSSGDIGPAVIDSLTLSAVGQNGSCKGFIHIAGDVWAVAFTANNSAVVKTFTCDALGNLGAAAIDTLTLAGIGAFWYMYQFLIHITGNVYAVVWTDINRHGWLTTITINNDGTFGAVLDSWEYENTRGEFPCMIPISGSVFAFITAVGGGAGAVKAVSINAAGIITPIAGGINFAPGVNEYQGGWIAHVSGDTYLIGYRDGSNDGWFKTVTITSAGAIGAIIDSWEYDPDYGEPHMLKISPNLAGTGQIFLVGSWQTGAVRPQVFTFEVLNTGVMTHAKISELTLVAADYAHYISVIEVGNGVFAACYEDFTGANSGKVTTFPVEVLPWVVLPTVTTDPATLITLTIATLNGTLDDDGGEACVCGFEYGLTAAYGTTTPTQSRTTGQPFSQIISGLTPGRLYHFRAIATNSAGTSYGSDRTFTTLVAFPTVMTVAATGVTEAQAQLNGMIVDDAGFPGDVSFEWGITTAYGQETPWLSGYGSGAMFWALIYPLAPGVAYHFRARFRNRYGVVYGVDMAFATLSAQGIAVLIDDAALLRFLEVV